MTLISPDHPDPKRPRQRDVSVVSWGDGLPPMEPMRCLGYPGVLVMPVEWEPRRPAVAQAYGRTNLRDGWWDALRQRAGFQIPRVVMIQNWWLWMTQPRPRRS